LNAPDDYAAKIHQSLIQPNLIMGCERELYMLTIMTSAMLAGPSGIFLANWGTAVFGAMLWVIGTVGLSAMAKRDPYLSKIYRRSVHYKKHYAAKSCVTKPESGYMRW